MEARLKIWTTGVAAALALAAGSAGCAQVLGIEALSGDGTGGGASTTSGGSTTSGTSTGANTTASTGSDTTTSTGGAMGCKAPEIDCSGQCVLLDSDPDHCGACDHSCLGGACKASVCQPIPIVSGQALPAAISVTDQGIYWLNASDGSVMAAGLDGSNPKPIASAQGATQDILATPA